MSKQINRRDFLKTTAINTAAFSLYMTTPGCKTQLTGSTTKNRLPNLVFMLADQWRAQATGYAGDPNASTPNLDKLEKQSINLVNAVSGCPVCSPYRASLITGTYPLTHGVFINDFHLSNDAVSIAQAYKNAGCDTAFIGKWHLDGRGRRSFIPKQARQGFDFWRAFECTHDYNNSSYFADDNVKLKWDGYDAFAQTRQAQKYITDHSKGKPFTCFLSWGPPHAPYHTAPPEYAQPFKDKQIKLRPNVPPELAEKARKDLRGYYSHIAALDNCVKDICDTIKNSGIEENTILVFTSDHGDLLYSHAQTKKQQPYEESARVPFLIRYPKLFGRTPRKIDMPFSSVDIMPTLLGLSGIEVPKTVEGKDFSKVLTGEQQPDNDAALLTCPFPFHQWNYANGGREYRGIRTRRYTYVKDLKGPWLLFDNLKDPYQLNNLADNPRFAELQSNLESILQRKLDETNDKFLPGPEYVKKWGYAINEKGYKIKPKP